MAAQELISGTISGTGATASFLVSGPVRISLTFAGTATVALQRQLDGTNWREVKEYTASAEETLEEFGDGALYRLNCSAHTNDVVYWIG